MTEFDPAPTRTASATALGAGVVGAIAVGLYSWIGLGAGVLGVLAFAGGLRRGSRRATTAGAGALLAGAFVAGAFGAPVGAVLLGTVAAVAAWDASTTATSVGAQLGRRADAGRIEALHVAASVGVGAFVGAVGYATYATAAGGYPFAAFVLLVVAVALLLAAVRSDPVAG